ncbi:DUF58 domain-containing protein [Candidatus Woesearchaeota archaeon]|nr:DUF58 domain-containing protein [Candidatus Woesearchaeota archaeon]
MREFKVNLISQITKLDVFTKRQLESSYAGNYQSLFKGPGIEFDRYRKYDQSDDAHMIDWKASLRSGDVMVKVSVEERNLDVFFVVDTSSTMSFGSTEKLKNEYVIELVASLAFGILQVGDRVGLAMINEGLKKFVSPSSGQKQFHVVTKALLNPEYYEGRLNFARSLRHLTSTIKTGKLLIIISDFLGLEPGWEKYFEVLSAKFEVVLGVMVRDPRDYALPHGVGSILVEDPTNGEKMEINPSEIQVQYAQAAEEKLKEVQHIFSRYKSNFLCLDTTQSFVNPMIRYFATRKMRML